MGKKGNVLGLFAITVTLMIVLGIREFSRSSALENKKSPPALPASFRKARKPSVPLNVTLTRIRANDSRVADIDDDGGLLRITSAPGNKIKTYVYERDGKELQRRSVEQTISFYIGPDGVLIPSRRSPIVDMLTPVDFPTYGEYEPPKCCPGSCILITRRKHNESPKKDSYCLFKDVQSRISVTTVDTNGTAMNRPSVRNVLSTTRIQPKVIVADSNSLAEADEVQNVFEGSSSVLVKSSKAIYESDRPISLLDRSEQDTFWLKEREGNAKSGLDRIVRIDEDGSTIIKLPAGYADVFRLVNTGALVAATLGKVGGDQPVRAYLKIGDDWKELSIPEGYDFSFVQKILRDGSMIGYITSADGKNIRQALWHGDGCVILNDLNGWPRQGILSTIVLANRRGDIYVRSVQNSQTNASEFYLLNVKVTL